MRAEAVWAWVWVLAMSVLKEISPKYSMEGLMLKQKLQYFGHLMWTADSLEKTLIMGKIEGRRRRGWQKMKWLDGITDSMDMNLGKLQEMVRNREAWHAAVHRVTKSWTPLKWKMSSKFLNWEIRRVLGPLSKMVKLKRISVGKKRKKKGLRLCFGSIELDVSVEYTSGKYSVQFSCSVVSNSLQPHEPQHTRLPSPSPTPRVYPN